jgi:plastocyanin
MRRLVVFAAAFIALSLGSLNLAAAGGGCVPPTGTTEGKGVEVKLANCSFLPTIIHAPVGAKVTWFNGDYLPHAINGLGWNATDPFAPASPGTNVSHTFALAGIYLYMCYVHPGMSGIVVVGDVAFNPNADGAMTTPAVANTAPAPIVAAVPNAPASVAAASAPAVELPIAIALALFAAIAGYAFARIPRYRLLGGALALRRRHGVHAR